MDSSWWWSECRAVEGQHPDLLKLMSSSGDLASQFRPGSTTKWVPLCFGTRMQTSCDVILIGAARCGYAIVAPGPADISGWTGARVHPPD